TGRRNWRHAVWATLGPYATAKITTTTAATADSGPPTLTGTRARRTGSEFVRSAAPAQIATATRIAAATMPAPPVPMPWAIEGASRTAAIAMPEASAAAATCRSVVTRWRLNAITVTAPTTVPTMPARE